MGPTQETDIPAAAHQNLLKLISVSNQQWKGSGERERLGCSLLGICEQSAIACAGRHPMEQEAQEGHEDKAS